MLDGSDFFSPHMAQNQVPSMLFRNGSAGLSGSRMSLSTPSSSASDFLRRPFLFESRRFSTGDDSGLGRDTTIASTSERMSDGANPVTVVRNVPIRVVSNDDRMSDQPPKNEHSDGWPYSTSARLYQSVPTTPSAQQHRAGSDGRTLENDRREPASSTFVTPFGDFPSSPRNRLTDFFWQPQSLPARRLSTPNVPIMEKFVPSDGQSYDSGNDTSRPRFVSTAGRDSPASIQSYTLTGSSIAGSQSETSSFRSTSSNDEDKTRVPQGTFITSVRLPPVSRQINRRAATPQTHEQAGSTLTSYVFPSSRTSPSPSPQPRRVAMFLKKASAPSSSSSSKWPRGDLPPAVGGLVRPTPPELQVPLRRNRTSTSTGALNILSESLDRRRGSEPYIPLEIAIYPSLDAISSNRSSLREAFLQTAPRSVNTPTPPTKELGRSKSPSLASLRQMIRPKSPASLLPSWRRHDSSEEETALDGTPASRKSSAGHHSVGSSVSGSTLRLTEPNNKDNSYSENTKVERGVTDPVEEIIRSLEEFDPNDYLITGTTSANVAAGFQKAHPTTDEDSFPDGLMKGEEHSPVTAAGAQFKARKQQPFNIYKQQDRYGGSDRTSLLPSPSSYRYGVPIPPIDYSNDGGSERSSRVGEFSTEAELHLRKRFLCSQLSDCADVIDLNAVKMNQIAMAGREYGSHWRHTNALGPNLPAIRDTLYTIEFALEELIDSFRRIELSRNGYPWRKFHQLASPLLTSQALIRNLRAHLDASGWSLHALARSQGPTVTGGGQLQSDSLDQFVAILDQLPRDARKLVQWLCELDVWNRDGTPVFVTSSDAVTTLSYNRLPTTPTISPVTRPPPPPAPLPTKLHAKTSGPSTSDFSTPSSLQKTAHHLKKALNADVVRTVHPLVATSLYHQHLPSVALHSQTPLKPPPSPARKASSPSTQSIGKDDSTLFRPAPGIAPDQQVDVKGGESTSSSASSSFTDEVKSWNESPFTTRAADTKRSGEDTTNVQSGPIVEEKKNAAGIQKRHSPKGESSPNTPLATASVVMEEDDLASVVSDRDSICDDHTLDDTATRLNRPTIEVPLAEGLSEDERELLNFYEPQLTSSIGELCRLIEEFFTVIEKRQPAKHFVQKIQMIVIKAQTVVCIAKMIGKDATIEISDRLRKFLDGEAKKLDSLLNECVCSARLANDKPHSVPAIHTMVSNVVQTSQTALDLKRFWRESCAPCSRINPVP